MRAIGGAFLEVAFDLSHPIRDMGKTKHRLPQGGGERIGRGRLKITFVRRCSFMVIATTTPERKVKSPIAAMAQAAPNRSAMMPAESAPMA